VQLSKTKLNNLMPGVKLSIEDVFQLILGAAANKHREADTDMVAQQ
jgi:hypothetical protein